MADATCKTCPLSTPWTPTQDGKPRVLCHRSGTEAESETADPARLETWWCSEHPLRQRDRLAAMAMQGLLAHPGTANWKPETFAKEAYRIADAMIAERERRAAPLPPVAA